MVVTVTQSGDLDEEQLAQVETFLEAFLPRMRQAPGVVEILHYADRQSGTATTVTVWQSEADVAAYRQSELIKEPMAFEQRLGLSSQRSGPFDVRRLDSAAGSA
jgi:quinol monooxygenase YgiN